MDFLQSEWFMWVTIIIVIGSIGSVFLNAFENAGFDEGEVWGYTKKAVKLIIGLILLPILIPIMVFFRKD